MLSLGVVLAEEEGVVLEVITSDVVLIILSCVESTVHSEKVE